MARRKARLATAIMALSFLCASCAHVERNPLSSEERLLLGASYEKKGEINLALREYSRAQELSPNDWRARFALGSLYLLKNEYAHAIEALELAKSSSNNPSVLNNLALAYLGAGRLDEAEGSVRAAVESGGPKAHAYLDTLGVVLMRRGDLLGAKEALTMAKDACPQDDKDALSEILLHLGELDALFAR